MLRNISFAYAEAEHASDDTSAEDEQQRMSNANEDNDEDHVEHDEVVV
jgi:hypothetical protein